MKCHIPVVRSFAVALAFFGLQLPLEAHATDYVVSSASDAGCDLDSELTLREALTAIATAAQCGEAPPGTVQNAVTFAGAIPYVLTVASALPAITRRTMLDGGGIVTLVGTPASSNGLVLRDHSQSVVRGFSITGFTNGAGIVIEQTTTPLTCGAHVISGNRIGVSANGLAASPNRFGIRNLGCAASTIGGNTIAARNVISGNLEHGVVVVGTTSQGVIVSGNFIGVGIDGMTPVPNGRLPDGEASYGVFVGEGAVDTFVGGDDATERNVIAGNAEGEVYIGSLATSIVSMQTHISGNFIGLDASGMARVAGGATDAAGIRVDFAIGTVIGGARPNALFAGGGNFIARESGHGIRVEGDVGATTITGNVIGLAIDGQTALPLAGTAISASSMDTLFVGGGTASLGNTIASANYGLQLQGSSTHAVVEANLFGFATDGITLRRNGIDLLTSAGSVQIGGTTDARANYFARGTTMGIWAVVQGDITFGRNFMGVNVNGVPTPSGARAMGLECDSVTIEDATIVGGTIETSQGVHVRIRSARIYGMSGNAIEAYGNAHVEIESSRVEPTSLFGALRVYPSAGSANDWESDPLDIDEGPNGLMNRPIVTRAAITTGGSVIEGAIDTHGLATIRVEVYRSAYAAASGQAVLSEHLGTATVETDAAGHAAYSIVAGRALVVGERVTAIATDVAEHGTSEASITRVVVDERTFADAGTPDAGTSDDAAVEMDADAGPDDAGTEDAGPHEGGVATDGASMTDTDAGNTPGDNGGCGCRAGATRGPSTVGTLVVFAFLFGTMRRRRTR